MNKCDIAESGDFVRAVVGPGPDSDIQECYRAIAVLCIQHQIRRALVISGNGDPTTHFALRDGIECAVQAGLAPDFRLALVAPAGPIHDVYEAALEEAGRLGITGKAFTSEADALGWLLSV